MKSLRIIPLLAVALLVAPIVSAADFGVRAGRFNDTGEDFIGAELIFDAGVLNINPNVEYQIGNEDITAGSANLDLTFDVASIGRATPYIGAGVGLSYIDDDFGGSETDVLANVIGGVSFDLEFLKPYAQVKYIRLLEDEDGAGDAEDDFAFVVGLRF